jgi:hypothetical protein
LAVAIGCHYTKISRIENGGQAPSEENIKAWCRACRAEDQIPDLIATARTIETMYVEWRRRTRAGMKRLMLSSVPLYERTTLFRIYEHNIIPGLFQTAEYSAAMLSYFIDFLDTPERPRRRHRGPHGAAAHRLLWQSPLRGGARRARDSDPSGKPRCHVRSARSPARHHVIARVSLGIIPAAAPHTVFTSVGFWIYDDAMVGVETPTAFLEVTQPREIRLYATMFAQLQQSAVYGAEARALITRAMADLRGRR